MLHWWLMENYVYDKQWGWVGRAGRTRAAFPNVQDDVGDGLTGTVLDAEFFRQVKGYIDGKLEYPRV